MHVQYDMSLNHVFIAIRQFSLIELDLYFFTEWLALLRQSNKQTQIIGFISKDTIDEVHQTRDVPFYFIRFPVFCDFSNLSEFLWNV